jgi:GT2 family glycosyltransferase
MNNQDMQTLLKEKDNPDILVIGIIYNTYAETLRYLESIPVDGCNITVLLVDNSDIKPDASFLEKAASYPFLHYHRAGCNSGYFGGAREGLKKFLSENDALPRWVLVTNVDIVFGPGFFQQLSRMGDQPGVGVLAPTIISEKWNIDYNPERREKYPEARLRFYLLIYSSFLLHNLFLAGAWIKRWFLSSRKMKNRGIEVPRQGTEKIYAPHGACLVFHRDYFLKGGMLDLPNFLYGEEVFVAETALHLNLDIVYHPELLVFDYEHASTGFFVTPAQNRYNRQAIRAILDHFYQ